jgi:hypothetical protein
MTVLAESLSEQFPGNGVADEFDFGFLIFDTTELVVRLIDDSTGVAELLVAELDYTIAVSDSGGTVTMTVPPEIGFTLDLRPIYEITQPTSIKNQGTFRPEIHERVMDRLTAQQQMILRLARRSIHLADYGEDDADLVLPFERAGSFLAFDANKNPVASSGTGTDAGLREDLANGVAALVGGNAIAYVRTLAEIAGGVTPANYSKAPYLRGRYSSWTDWAAACDEAGAEGKLDANYAITADIYLPKKSDFAGFQITGIFRTIHAKHSQGWVQNWAARRPCIWGAFKCSYTNVDTLADASTDKIQLMGGDPVAGGANPGCFWNRISISQAGCTELNADRFDVNQNTFYGGLSRYAHLTGGAGGAGTIHANRFIGFDFSHSGGGPDDSGYLQDDEARAKNFIRGIYYENGANIRGNVELSDFQGDAQGMPLVDRRNHITGSVGINVRVRADFIALSKHNLARGGCWDWLDADGKPVCLSHSGGASVSVQADSDEPGGTGLCYQATLEQLFDNFNITLQPSATGHSSVVIYYRSTANFGFIESNYSGAPSATSYDTEPARVDADPAVGNDVYKMLRLSVPSSRTGVTVINLGISPAISPTVFRIGSIFASQEVASPHPTRNEETGSGIYGPVATAVANLDSVNPGLANYVRTQGGVLVTGDIVVDPTAGATLTRLRLTLPITPTAFALATNASGTCAASAVAESGRCFADTVNSTEVEIAFLSASAASHTISYQYLYRL